MAKRGIGRRGIARAAAGVWLLLTFIPMTSAQAQTPGPPTVVGTVAGGLVVGDELTIRVDATAVGGWQNLHQVLVTVVDGAKTLDQLTFDIENNKLDLSAQDIVIGTGATATGNFLRVNGADVVLTTGAANLSFGTTARVLKAIPTSARFRLGVVDDFGRTASLTRALNVGTTKGLTWSTVIAAVVMALLAGGLVGNLFASHRRPPQRLSVYGTIQRRMGDEGKRAASK